MKTSFLFRVLRQTGMELKLIRFLRKHRWKVLGPLRVWIFVQGYRRTDEFANEIRTAMRDGRVTLEEGGKTLFANRQMKTWMRGRLIKNGVKVPDL